ncbi:MAG TPA: spherulation-specific family 4 protein [Solimonas sp.]|nr:spherulation-specific family 4 protein [Solimonas sp.]
MRSKRCITLLLGLLPLSAQALPELLIPAYFDPSTDSGRWSQMASAASSAPLTVVMNPNSGPGAAADASYTAAIDAVRANGGRVIGYVATGFGGRAAAAVKADIDSYLAFYPVLDGIFLDEMTNDADAAHLNYYGDIYQYIKAKGAALRVVGNPGSATPESYLTRPVADVIVIFENPESEYAANPPASFVASYPASRFAMIAFGQPSAAGMAGDLSLAHERHTGLVFVTDDTETLADPNPYDTLPGYFSQEVAAVAAQQPASGGDGYGGGGSGAGSGGGYGSGGVLPPGLLLGLLLLAAGGRSRG